MGKLIQSGDFNIPPPSALPNSTIVLPNYLIGDDAFALAETMMKPYCRKQCLQDDSKAVFNYRLCRARRTVENAFGIMASYFRIFFTPINVKPSTIDKIVLACCALHNLMRSEKIPSPSEAVFGSIDECRLPTENLLPLRMTHGRNRNTAVLIRDQLKDYLNGTGAVSWQDRMIN